MAMPCDRYAFTSASVIVQSFVRAFATSMNLNPPDRTSFAPLATSASITRSKCGVFQ